MVKHRERDKQSHTETERPLRTAAEGLDQEHANTQTHWTLPAVRAVLNLV